MAMQSEADIRAQYSQDLFEIDEVTAVERTNFYINQVWLFPQNCILASP